MIVVRIKRSPQVDQYQCFEESWYLFGLILLYRRERLILV